MGMNCCTPKCWKIVLLVVVGIVALGWVVMALWNWLMPALFAGAKEIGYVQAMGLLVLSKILFGGFRGHGCHGRLHRNRWKQMTPEELVAAYAMYKEIDPNRWGQMTPEEREKFQAGMRSCCGKSKQED